jgi:L-fucose isomerase-like protein
MSNKVTLIGLYSHAHPRNISEERINNAVDLLKQYNVDVNFIGNLSDHDDVQLDTVRKKFEDSVNGSCCIMLVYSGWSESTGILNILSGHLHLPLIIWSLAGYRIKTGVVAPASAAGVSLLRNTLNRLNVKYRCVYDALDSVKGTEKILSYINIFSSIHEFKRTKIASIGYACSNLYPFMYDGNLIKEKTGVHVDNLELLELKEGAEKITEKETGEFRDNFNKRFDREGKFSDDEKEKLSRYYVALSRIIEKNAYKGISIKCGSGPGRFLGFTPCMLLSIIGDEINAICECDIYGLLAQTIVSKLTGLRPTFLEIFEFYKESVLMASCGFVPFSICKNDCTKIYQHEWDDSGGLMNISAINGGSLTVFNFFVKNNSLKMQVFTGNGINPERFQEEGWENHKGPMLPSLEIRFDSGIDVFKENIISPHYIIVHGNHTEIIDDYCWFSGIEIEKFF